MCVDCGGDEDIEKLGYDDGKKWPKDSEKPDASKAIDGDRQVTADALTEALRREQADIGGR